MTTKLTPIKSYKPFSGPLLLIIMDGIGIGKKDEFDAVHLAKTPTLDSLYKTHPFIQLKAHGPAVGMPTNDDMGNSEVGHNTLGAGRAIPQGATLVKQAIESGSIFKGNTWKKIIHNVKTHSSTLHFITLLSDGNVHSHIDHLLAMLKQAASESIRTCRIHILLDGRDVGQRSALTYVKRLESILDTINANNIMDYKIASGGGRMVITMDRYNADWNMVELGWKTHVLGIAAPFQSATDAINHAYSSDPNLNDQYIPPFVITSNDEPIGSIQDHDSVILANFRGDRAMEITQAFENKSFTRFDRQRIPNIEFAGMMEYDGDAHIPKQFLINPPQIDRPLSYYLCNEAIPSFAISETQKYGHVTYFWNGNNSGYIDESLETYIEIPSDNIPFDQQPNMKAIEITDKAIELLQSKSYKFGRINFPNGDMVGHTGNLAATIQSVETTDQCIKRLIDCMSDLNGITIILADHGNADEMATKTNNIITPKTSHSLNPVPCCIVNNTTTSITIQPISSPGLSNIASTICNLLGFESPDDYDQSLITLSDT